MKTDRKSDRPRQQKHVMQPGTRPAQVLFTWLQVLLRKILVQRDLLDESSRFQFLQRRWQARIGT